jgi:hypothetical protein
MARMERDALAVGLRARGYAFDQIAVELGFCDRSAARKACERGLAHHLHETVEEARALELQRTDVMIEQLMPLIERDVPDLRAMNQLIKVMDLRAKMLGLYRTGPQKPELPADYVVKTDTPEKVALVQEFIGLRQTIYQEGFEDGKLAALRGDDDGYDDNQDDDCDEDLTIIPMTRDSTETQNDNADDDNRERGEWRDGRWYPSDDTDSASPTNTTSADVDDMTAPPQRSAADARRSVEAAFSGLESPQQALS